MGLLVACAVAGALVASGVAAGPLDADYEFSKYLVLAVFYKGRELWFGDDVRFDSVQESAAGDLSATVTFECHHSPLCAVPSNDPADPGACMY